MSLCLDKDQRTRPRSSDSRLYKHPVLKEAAPFEIAHLLRTVVAPSVAQAAGGGAAAVHNAGIHKAAVSNAPNETSIPFIQHSAVQPTPLVLTKDDSLLSEAGQE